MIDLSNRRFGLLVALHPQGKTDQGNTLWLCRCDCGKTKTIIGSSLTSKRPTRSCGCRQGRRDEIGGKVFGRLTVIKPHSLTKFRELKWECVCSCGNKRIVIGRNLKNGNTKSCGCLGLELCKGKRGSLHPRWNPDLTDDDRRSQHHGKSSEMERKLQVWRTRIYKRDNYTCQVCFMHGVYIQAHHLNSWDSNKKERYNLANGISLCRECHKDFHQEYGMGQNTLDEFNEWREDLD